MQNYSFLYSFNKQHYARFFDCIIKNVEVLKVEKIKNAYILPCKSSSDRLFGLGGVLDSNCEFVNLSKISTFGSNLSGINEIITFGGKYLFSSDEVDTIDADVIYLGLITNHWGHFLVDFSTRLYSVFEDYCNQDKKFVFVVKEKQNFSMIRPIERFLEIIGIDKTRIYFINKVTRFSNVTVPEVSYKTNSFFSSKFLKIFDFVSEHISCATETYEKVYFSRGKWGKAKNTEYGEDLLQNIYERNGYKVIFPEKLSLDEQIHIIKHANYFSAVTGTIPHNLLFANDKLHVTILNKTYNLNMMQRDINFMKKIDVTFVDCYYSMFPTPLGSGPFILTLNDNFINYCKENNIICNLKCNNIEINNIKKYVKTVRVMNCDSSFFLDYNDDEDRSNYYNPQNVILFQKKFYFEVYRVRLFEKIKHRFFLLSQFLNKLKNHIK